MNLNLNKTSRVWSAIFISSKRDVKTSHVWKSYFSYPTLIKTISSKRDVCAQITTFGPHSIRFRFRTETVNQSIIRTAFQRPPKYRRPGSAPQPPGLLRPLLGDSLGKSCLPVAQQHIFGSVASMCRGWPWLALSESTSWGHAKL